MPTPHQFTNDELAQLHLLVSQDVGRTWIELYQAAAQPYREYLKRRMGQEMALLKKMEQAVPVLGTGGEDRWATGMCFVYSVPLAGSAACNAGIQMQG
jgi:hypothetical protein